MLAVDLGSTNGTMLLREDRAPLRLRAGVATNVDFGDWLDVSVKALSSRWRSCEDQARTR